MYYQNIKYSVLRGTLDFTFQNSPLDLENGKIL